MNDKTVITQNTPHKVTVSEGSSHASRPKIQKGQGGGPSVIETPNDRQAVPVVQDPVRGDHAFDKSDPTGPIGHVDFGTQAPRMAQPPSNQPPADPDKALLDDWSLSADLIERIGELRANNTRTSEQIDQLTAPAKKARATGRST